MGILFEKSLGHMGDKKKGLCGCAPYIVVIPIMAAVEIILAVVCIVTENWFLWMYVPKVILLLIGATCCRKNQCPRIAAMWIFIVATALELIGTMWLWATMRAYAYGICCSKD